MAGEIKFTIDGTSFTLKEGDKLKKNDLKELKWLGSLWNDVDNDDNKLDKEEADVLRQLSTLLGSGVEWTKESVGKLIKEFEDQNLKLENFLADKVLAKQQAEQQAIANKGTAESYGDFEAAFDKASKEEGFDEKKFVEEFLANKLAYAQKFSDYGTYKAQKLAENSTLAEKDIVFEFIKSKLDEAKKLDGYDAALAEAEKADDFDIYKFTQEFIAKKADSKATAGQGNTGTGQGNSPVDPQAELKAKYTNDYTINQDETLGFIAKKILQDGGNAKPTRDEIMKLVNEIAEMNGIDKNTYLIRVGQKIKLPVAKLTGVQTITSGRKPNAAKDANNSSGASGTTGDETGITGDVDRVLALTTVSAGTGEFLKKLKAAKNEAELLSLINNMDTKIAAYVLKAWNKYPSLTTMPLGSFTPVEDKVTVALVEKVLQRATELGINKGDTISSIQSLYVGNQSDLINGYVAEIIKKDRENIKNGTYTQQNGDGSTTECIVQRNSMNLPLITLKTTTADGDITEETYYVSFGVKKGLKTSKSKTLERQIKDLEKEISQLQSARENAPETANDYVTLTKSHYDDIIKTKEGELKQLKSTNQDATT